MNVWVLDLLHSEVLSTVVFTHLHVHDHLVK